MKSQTLTTLPHPLVSNLFLPMKFMIFDSVSHLTDPESRGIITGIVTRPKGYQYLVTWEDREEKPHYEPELVKVADKYVPRPC